MLKYGVQLLVVSALNFEPIASTYRHFLCYYKTTNR